MRHLLRWVLLVGAALLLLQAYFAARIALMIWVNPESTTFQRSELVRLARDKGLGVVYRHQWVPYARISDNLKRAVIAAEDDGFVNHDGVDWNAIERAWARNAAAEELAKRQAQAKEKLGQVLGKTTEAPPPMRFKIIGGSTITQQLAKNLFLSGERTMLRKGQELILTKMLERMLSKERILEIYLNSVEWGEGVFGAEAAARRYFGRSAASLERLQAARLAVMLPRPRHFEKYPRSTYLAGRAALIAGRMGRVELP
jgi:monofunctional biosynthetic peptidoglycan transglycosylase